MSNRAYSVLNVKSLNDEERVITGVATTPQTDRVGDIVVSSGVKFSNPIPLLWQHDHTKPVGTVEFSAPTEKGVEFVARLPKIEEAGALKDRVDEAWQSVKAGLITAVSIGFRAMDGGIEILKNGGYKFLETEVYELSLVTIPANSEATIQTIKSFDAVPHAALGTPEEPQKKQAHIVRLDAGDSAKPFVIKTIKRI